jgi:hypothetical protein
MLRIECADCAAPVEEHPEGFVSADGLGVSFSLDAGDYVPGESTTARCFDAPDRPSLQSVTVNLVEGGTECAIAGPNATQENERFGCGFVIDLD